ncbi:pectin lyase-like protein [Microthyrium microscopicum]|uniref:Pectin lyase-like protein n=1 Tax=Microthyrium microscopicum TaxID=703497 RepID=A0A6A6UNY2_9PEZI|nr:pectin lyase-like protein [Microthyrium microscopicum]
MGSAPSSAAAPAAAGGYWLAAVQRQGTVPFGTTGYKVYRNVKDYGAKGDGSTDDTAAINLAISDGNRCGSGCDSSTTTPALVYFPAGTYVVSKPIVQYYYTQMIGDATNPPTLKASAAFEGMAVIDADPYEYVNGTAANWYTNQNNFFRQVRNFVIDLTGITAKNGAGIHWQVAQGTSLQNIRFEMVQGASTQSGVFMDNGSGGFMSDLVFNGGNTGAFVGSQQFTSRNMTFNNCNTAIFMNWNWLWTWKSITVNNCKVGLDMANSPANQTVGSVLLQDSSILNTPVGVNTSFAQQSIPTGGGTLIIDNVDFTGSPAAVKSYTGATVLNGGGVVDSWAQGQMYAGSTGTRQQGPVTAAMKPKALMGSDGKIFERSKPQYESYPASSFVSIKSAGAKGDGQTDDTAAIQTALNSLQDNQVLYFDHGAYIVTKTVNVPGNKNIKITGEIWPLIMAKGTFFGDETNPQPVFSVGQANDTGAVEMSDLIFETVGSVPGAIMMQWNSNAAMQGTNGLWDVHFRIGGSAGTDLQSDKCSKDPTAIAAANPACIGAHTLFHATQSASVLLENTWFWVADHELDIKDHNQINIFNGRGVLLESQNPVWMYGTASEHSVMYQYQLNNAANVYMSVIQSETPYFQTNPAAPAPFKVQATDPQFTGVSNADNKAWGLRIVNSSDVLVFGAGLYSFFENYDQKCVNTETCQNGMVSIEGTTNNLNLFGLSTKAAVNMVSTTGYTVGAMGSANATLANSRAVASVQVPDADNRSNFCATLALWRPE